MSDTVTTRPTTPDDLPLIAEFHARVFGPGRFARTAYRVRERKAASSSMLSRLCRAAFLGPRMIASVTFTMVRIGSECRAALLGPLAVDPDFAGQGYARRLVAEALDEARHQALNVVVLVGDEPYYRKLGFKPVLPGRIVFPGPVDPVRILACELAPGVLDKTRGLITPL